MAIGGLLGSSSRADRYLKRMGFSTSSSSFEDDGENELLDRPEPEPAPVAPEPQPLDFLNEILEREVANEKSRLANTPEKNTVTIRQVDEDALDFEAFKGVLADLAKAEDADPKGLSIAARDFGYEVGADVATALISNNRPQPEPTQQPVAQQRPTVEPPKAVPAKNAALIPVVPEIEGISIDRVKPKVEGATVEGARANEQRMAREAEAARRVPASEIIVSTPQEKAATLMLRDWLNRGEGRKATVEQIQQKWDQINADEFGGTLGPGTALQKLREAVAYRNKERLKRKDPNAQVEIEVVAGKPIDQVAGELAESLRAASQNPDGTFDTQKLARAAEQRQTGQSLVAGGLTIKNLLSSGVEAVGEVAGARGLEEFGRRGREINGALLAAMPQGTTLRDVESVGDAVNYVLQLAGEQGPMMAATMGAGGLGRMVAGSIGMKAGSFGMGAALGTGGIQSSAKEQDAEHVATIRTLLGGAAVGALDSITPNRLLGTLLRNNLGEEAANEVATRILLMPAAGRAAREAGAGAVREAPTEALQGLVEEITVSLETGQPIRPGLIGRLAEQAVAGAVVGGGMGAGVSAANDLARAGQPPRRPPPPELDIRLDTARPGVRPAADRALPAEERNNVTRRVRATPAPVDAEGREQRFIPPQGTVTSRVGPRKSFRTENGAMASSNHKGTDYGGMKLGAPVTAGADGVVVEASPNAGGHGKRVTIKFSDGTTASYSHNSKLDVKKGDVVRQGDVIARAGKTGNATGVHVHLELRDRRGRILDPASGKPITVVTNVTDDGQQEIMDDDTPYDVVEETEDNELEEITQEERDEWDAAWEDTTGTRIAEPEDEVATEAAPRPAEQVAAEAGIQLATRDPAQTASEARSRLDALQGRATEQLPPDQPGPNEEPVFRRDESGNPTAEVMGFLNPETGVVRPLGETTAAAPETAIQRDQAPAATQQRVAAQPLSEPATAAPVLVPSETGKQRVLRNASQELVETLRSELGTALPPAKGGGFAVPNRLAARAQAIIDANAAPPVSEVAEQAGLASRPPVTAPPAPPLPELQLRETQAIREPDVPSTRAVAANEDLALPNISVAAINNLSDVIAVAPEVDGRVQLPTGTTGGAVGALMQAGVEVRQSDLSISAADANAIRELGIEGVARANNPPPARQSGDVAINQPANLATPSTPAGGAKTPVVEESSPAPATPMQKVREKLTARRAAAPKPAPEKKPAKRDTTSDDQQAKQRQRPDSSWKDMLSRMAEAEATGGRAMIDSGTLGVQEAERRGFIAPNDEGRLKLTDKGRAVIGAKPKRATPAPKLAPAPPKRPAAVQKRVDQVTQKLDDMTISLASKPAAGAYAKKLVKEGIIPQERLDAISYLWKDRDMGIDDVVPEIQSLVEEWADEQAVAPAPAKKGKIKERREDTRPSVTVAAEVAPDPDNRRLAEDWNKLSPEAQAEITRDVANDVVPLVQDFLNARAEAVGQIGGFEGKTNPSLTLSLADPDAAMDMARALGYVFDQKSMLVMSETPFEGGVETGAITITLPAGVEPADVYDRLWQLEANGEKLVGGFLMNGEDMVILNFSGTPTDTVAAMVDGHLGGEYGVNTGAVYADFPQKGSDFYGYGTPRFAAERTELDRLRSEAIRSRYERVNAALRRADQERRDRERADAERARQTSRERPEADPDGTILLTHDSPTEGLTVSDPTRWGQGISPKEERNNVSSAPGRTYFGVHTNEPGGYVGEYGPGAPRYTTRLPLEMVYDFAGDPDNIVRPIMDGPGPMIVRFHRAERAIQEAGYTGYWRKHPALGLIAAVFDPVPLKRAGNVEKITGSKWRRDPMFRDPVEVRKEKDARVRAATPQVLDELAKMGLLGRSDLGVQIVATLGKGIAGHFSAAESLIRVAAMSGHNARLTTRHEVMHWAKEIGVFNKAEWAIIENWAKNSPGLMAWARENYKDRGLTESEIIEEAAAEGFARIMGGETKAEGALMKAVRKMAEIVQAVQRAFGRAGISRRDVLAAHELMNKLYSGEQVATFDQRQAKKVETTREEEIRRDVLRGRLTPGEADYLLANPSLEKNQAAYHGTPHDFDRFDLQFIGSGEGAQVFGWGLYFAQSKQIADWYRRKLAVEAKLPVDQVIEVKGVPIRDFFEGRGLGIAPRHVADHIHEFLSASRPYNGWLDAIHAKIDNEFDRHVANAEADGDTEEVEGLRADQVQVAAVMKSLRGQQIELAKTNEGKLFKVEVPDDSDLLDLDAELGNQPEKVKAALAKVRNYLESSDNLDIYEDMIGAPFEEWTGKELQTKIIKQMGYDNAFPDGVSEAIETALENGHWAKAGSLWLKELGIAGNRYLDSNSRDLPPGEKATRNFVIFDDGLVTIKDKQRRVSNAVANSPLSDPTTPSRFLIGPIHDMTMGFLSRLGQRNGKLDPTDNIVDAFRRKVTQRYQQIIKTQRRVAEQQGVGRLAPDQNVMEQITADERGYRLELLNDTMVRPMAQKLAKHKLELAELGAYLYARHAPARNARVAAINPEFRDPAKPGSGMTDAEAAQIIADFTANGKLAGLQDVANEIDAMVKFAQQERLNAGLLSQADIAAGFGPNDFYVPLRGNEELEPEHEMDFAVRPSKGGGFSVAGRESQRMFGRQSKADLEEIVGYTISQAQQAVDRAYRNRVGQAMLKMFRSAPDPKFVQIERVKRVAVWNEKRGQVEYQMQTRVTDPLEQQRTIYVKVDGETQRMTFQASNPSAMRFVKAAKNLGASELPRWMEIVSVFTRLWSKSNTQWNIDFILANATKDMQGGILNATTLDVKGLRRSMVKNLTSLRPLRAALQGAFNEAGAGLNSTDPWFQTFAEFEANGGKLNYGQNEPLEDIIRQTRGIIKDAQRGKANPIKLVKGLGQWIDNANSGFENMTRLAAYKALRDRGIPAKQAAEAVRELTTNFQQHGEWGPKVNAIYGFANASIIGGARFAYTVAKNPTIIGGLMMLGATSDIINHMLGGEEWDEWKEEEKHANFIILLPDEVGFDIKIPAGYGLNAFITSGRKLSELWRGKKREDGAPLSAWDAAGDVAMGFVNAFAPITGATPLNIAAPTVADPFVNLYQNKNNWGRPIMPNEAFREEDRVPHSELAFDNTAAFWKGLATTINDWTGGNSVEFGAISVSPESFKHVTEEFVGGAGRSVMRALALPGKLASGEVGPNDVPVVRRFIGNPGGSSDKKAQLRGDMYERLSAATTIISQARRLRDQNDDDWPEFREKNKAILRFSGAIESADKRLTALNAADNAAEKGALNAKGLKPAQWKKIKKETGIALPLGRKLTDEEVAKVKEATRVKKERLASKFNERYLREVMGVRE